MPVTIDEISPEVSAAPPVAQGVWGPYQLNGWGTEPVAREGFSTPELPRNMWDADLQGYEPTEEDYAYWAQQESLEPAFDMLTRAGDFGWCESTRSDGSTQRDGCFKSPYLDQY